MLQTCRINIIACEVKNKEFGFAAEQLYEFTKKCDRKQQEFETGKALKKKVRTLKYGNEMPPSVQRLSKLT